MKTDIISNVRQALLHNVDEQTQRTGHRVFKEEVKLYGVKVPMVNRISKDYYAEIKDKPKNEIFALCEELWQSGYSEESYVACNWSYYIHK